MAKHKKDDQDTQDFREIDITDLEEENNDTEVVPDEDIDTGDVTVEEKPAESEELVKRFEQLNEKYVRLLAEYDNYRKRTAREMTNLVETASENLITSLLPILDNLDRATEHRSDKTSLEEYAKGIALIEDQFRDILARAGLEPLNATGEPFDPNLHDAIMQMESDEHQSGAVIQEVEKGYLLNGKVIRHSKVVVSK